MSEQKQVVSAPQSRRTIAFVVVAMLLIVAAIGLRVTVANMKLTFRKLPVELPAPLLSIKRDLGPWAQFTVDEALPADIEHELGTKEYVMRRYVDTRQLSESDRAKFIAAALDERQKMMTEGKISVPKSALMYFALTYYTGSADTVPHVSERCYVADGFKPTNFEVLDWAILPRENEADRVAKVRLLNFEDQVGSRSFEPKQVCYFFQVNGTYEHDPIFGVRKKLQNLFERHAYFAKVEMSAELGSTAAAAPVMKDFLVHAMPEVERVLPDWEKVKAMESGDNRGDAADEVAANVKH